MVNRLGHTMSEPWMLVSCHIMAQTTDWVVYLVCRSFSPTQRNYAWALALLSSHSTGFEQGIDAAKPAGVTS